MSNNNSFIDPKAREALQRAKAEIAEDMKVYNQAVDRGTVNSHTLGVIGGNIGGNMTKRLVAMGEELLIQQYGNKNK